MMGRTQKTLTITLWALAVLCMIGLVTTGVLAKRYSEMRKQSEVNLDPPEERMPVLFAVPDFTFTDQNKATFKREDLKGKIWIADFIFTTCPGICPTMTEKMGTLSKSLAAAKINFVSFSLDPEHDTPAALMKYAKNWKADPARWHFLTGDANKIYDIARGMKVAAQPATATSPIVHSEKFVLVDAAGNIRGYYNSTDESELKQLETDAADLASGKVPTASGGA
jgi:protein SCO1/2